MAPYTSLSDFFLRPGHPQRAGQLPQRRDASAALGFAFAAALFAVLAAPVGVSAAAGPVLLAAGTAAGWVREAFQVCHGLLQVALEGGDEVRDHGVLPHALPHPRVLRFPAHFLRARFLVLPFFAPRFFFRVFRVVDVVVALFRVFALTLAAA